MSKNKKPRILIVSTAYLPLVGGAELAVKEITNRLGGYDFDLITARLDPGLERHEIIGRVHVRRIGIGVTTDKYFLPCAVFLKALGRTRYDAIWTVMASYGSIGAVFYKKIRPHTKHFLTLQEGDSEEHILRRVGIFYPFWRSIFKNADYIQAISKYLADFARRHGARCPVEVVPNGVDVERFKNLKPKTKNSQPIIITTSRLVHKNGIDTLIEATQKLRSLIPDSKFLIQIVGKGQDEKKLKVLAKKLDVENMVEFVGHVDPDKIPDYLAKADIFVRPARSEGLGSSFIEAMAAGLPIIGTPVGGIPDFLKDPSAYSGQATGLFAEPENPNNLAQKIKMLIENDDLRVLIAQNARKLALDNYSWDSVAKSMDNIFGKLL